MADLAELIAASKAWWEAATPAQKAAMHEAQRRSYVASQMAWGSDADEPLRTLMLQAMGQKWLDCRRKATHAATRHCAG